MRTSPIQLQAVNDFASEARSGLRKAGQKELPSLYLYDEVGSALFEAITVLPEYGLTRAGERLLARVNRELDATFDLTQWRHLARYDETGRRVEMHLRSLADQTVIIRRADIAVSFREDETIWTESSHEYDPDEVMVMAARSGFKFEAQWLDEEWPFADILLTAW